MQKQQTSTHLNEALAKRPDREQLEQQHILTPSTSTSASVSAAVAKPVRLLALLSIPWLVFRPFLLVPLVLFLISCFFFHRFSFFFD